MCQYKRVRYVTTVLALNRTFSNTPMQMQIFLTKALVGRDKVGLALRTSMKVILCAMYMRVICCGMHARMCPGDIRLAKLMVDFKHRYPDRVFLLVPRGGVHGLACASFSFDTYITARMLMHFNHAPMHLWPTFIGHHSLLILT